MSSDEQGEPIASGSVPHAFRNRLFWNWVKAMPPRTSSGFVSFLYALGAAANPAGFLRFRDGTPLTIEQFAGGLRGDEKQVSVWVDAAIAAGVLTFEGSRKQGATPVYALVLSPCPDWGASQSVMKAAAAALNASRDARKNRKAPPWKAEESVPWDEEFGGRSPELEEPEFGGPSPDLPLPGEDEVPGTVPGSSSGDGPPRGSGDGPRNNPGVPMCVPQEVARLGGQPQVARASPPEDTGGAPPAEAPRPVQAAFLIGLPGGGQLPEPDTPPAADWTRCNVCHGRLITRPGRTTHHAHCIPDERNTG